MVRKSILLDLLNRRDWAQLQPLVDRFQSWQFYPLFVHAVEHLNLDVLYESKIHGLGHIERTLCHGGMSAMDEHLSEADTSLLLDACAARFIGLVTGRTGEDLLILKAAVEAHSRKEKEMQSVLDKYHPSDMARAKNIAQLLKDADGLDRVRICDLDENFLRRESSVHREPFAHQLYIRYQTVVGLPLVPDFVPEMLKHRNREKVWL